MKYLLMILSIFLVMSCAHKQEITYIEAKKTFEPTKPPVVVEVAKPLPLPGQLQKIPEAEKEETPEKPWKVIRKANKAASHNPSTYGYFNAIMQYDFAPGALYQVYCAPLKLTDIQLQKGEKLIGKPVSGDTVRWIMGMGKSIIEGVDRQHIYIKPTRPGLKTTLNINTDKRTYHIELQSYKETYMAAVNFRYPHDEISMIESQAARETARNNDITSSLVSIDQLNFGYKVKVKKGKKPLWMPVKIFDDGRKTFIQFPKEMLNNEAPTLFILSDKNKTQLVNYRVKNEYYVIDRLFTKAELRLGQKKQTIVRILKVEESKG